VLGYFLLPSLSAPASQGKCRQVMTQQMTQAVSPNHNHSYNLFLACLTLCVTPRYC
jgi:hypothetical protein